MPERPTQSRDAVDSSGGRLSARPGARERGRMRRRLRQQRRMREALLLDLGALVFELQRQGRREPELLQAKAAELNAVDQEVRVLAHALEAGHTVLELVATGVAGSCGNCGSLLSTDARYCSACGAPAVPSLERDGRGGGPALAPGRAAGRRPSRKRGAPRRRRPSPKRGVPPRRRPSPKRVVPASTRPLSIAAEGRRRDLVSRRRAGSSACVS